MANGSTDTEKMIERMAEEGGGTERNAKPPEQKKRKPKKLPQASDDPKAWEKNPASLRSPVG